MIERKCAEMDLKYVKNKLYLWGAFVFAFLLLSIGNLLFLIPALISVAKLIVMNRALWRCPHCDKPLGNVKRYCTHCGKELDL